MTWSKISQRTTMNWNRQTFPIILTITLTNIKTYFKTRWTFFRVKLVFEFWVWDILVLRSLGPLDSSTSYFPLHPHTSSYLCLLRTSFGMERGGGELWHLTMRLEMDLWPLYCTPGTSYFLLHSLTLISSHLFLISPSYSILLPNLLITPHTSFWRLSDDWIIHT